MDDILAKSLIEKVEGQESKIAEIEAGLKNLSGNADEIELLKNEVLSLKSDFKEIHFPVQDMRNLTKTANELRKQLNQPVQSTVKHHHYVHKIAWLTVVLFVSTVVAGIGWYMAGTASKEYKANDTKYRYLKLYGNNSLLETLFIADSLYRAYPDMRDSVIQKENQNREKFEMLQEANNKEKEAKELKRKAKDL